MSVCEVISRPPAPPPVPDLESRLAWQEARAEAAEARIAELEAELLEARAVAERRKWESATARNKLNSLRATFEKGRAKLAAAREELRQTRASQASRNVRLLAKKVVHLEALLKQAGIDGGRGHATILRKRISRLKDKHPCLPARGFFEVVPGFIQIHTRAIQWFSTARPCRQTRHSAPLPQAAGSIRLMKSAPAADDVRPVPAPTRSGDPAAARWR